MSVFLKYFVFSFSQLALALGTFNNAALEALIIISFTDILYPSLDLEFIAFLIFNSSNTYEGFNDLPSKEYINGLLSGSRWDNISSDSATLTTELKYYLYDNESVPYEGKTYKTVEISPEEINAINYSFESFSNVADITFTKTNSANEAHIAWLLFDNSDGVLDGLAGVAYLPRSEFPADAGYIAMNASYYSDGFGSNRKVINN